MAGVIAGALMAKRGFKSRRRAASTSRADASARTDYHGYWINWGHRDATATATGLDLQ